MSAADDLESRRQMYRARFEALETIRLKEIRALTDEEALRQIMSLVAVGPLWHERPDWSGLVEQQALFHGRKPKVSPPPE